MDRWCFSRLNGMLAITDNVTVEELRIISDKYGGAENMFEMVRANTTVFNQYLEECHSVRTLFQFAEAINVPKNDLKQVIQHYGVFNLLELLDGKEGREGYGWPSLTYMRTMLKYREECPVKFGPKITTANGDCMLIGLRDGALDNPQLKGRKQIFLQDLNCEREDLVTGNWDTTKYRRKSCHFGMEIYAGHCSKPAESCKFNHNVNIKPVDMSNKDWKTYWVELMKPGVFDLPSNLGPLAGNISDSTLPLAAFYLKRHILVFHGEMNSIEFVDGNVFKRGNVEDDAPFILGKSRNHYQTLVPDDDSDPQAYQKIRDYVRKKSFEYARDEAIELSIKLKSASDDDDSHHGSGNINKTLLLISNNN